MLYAIRRLALGVGLILLASTILLVSDLRHRSRGPSAVLRVALLQHANTTVLEDGIRSYLGGSRIVSQEAEFWIYSQRRQSPFSFGIVCEVLGLDPDAVRKTLKRMKSENVSPRKALPRARHNVRIPGRVYARKSH